MLPAAQLGGRPVGTPLAGERVVLFRDHQGRAHALIDRCPHRGVALSLGRVSGQGELECPFHGWTFAGDGACTRAPWNPQARCETLGATPLPLRERGGLLWVYTAPGLEAPTEPHVPDTLVREDLKVFLHAEEWACHWTRAQENMLDFPHLPFVHGRTIGAGLRRLLAAKPTLAITSEVQPTTAGLTFITHTGEPEPSRLDWLQPNGMELFISARPLLRMNVYCVPLEAKRTRMILCAARSFGRYNPIFDVLDRFNLRILREDRAVVESSDPPEVPPPAQERSVASDKATLRFRQWYLSELKGRSAPARPALAG